MSEPPFSPPRGRQMHRAARSFAAPPAPNINPWVDVPNPAPPSRHNQAPTQVADLPRGNSINFPPTPAAYHQAPALTEEGTFDISEVHQAYARAATYPMFEDAGLALDEEGFTLGGGGAGGPPVDDGGLWPGEPDGHGDHGIPFDPPTHSPANATAGSPHSTTDLFAGDRTLVDIMADGIWPVQILAVNGFYYPVPIFPVNGFYYPAPSPSESGRSTASHISSITISDGPERPDSPVESLRSRARWHRGSRIAYLASLYAAQLAAQPSLFASSFHDDGGAATLPPPAPSVVPAGPLTPLPGAHLQFVNPQPFAVLDAPIAPRPVQRVAAATAPQALAQPARLAVQPSVAASLVAPAAEYHVAVAGPGPSTMRNRQIREMGTSFEDGGRLAALAEVADAERAYAAAAEIAAEMELPDFDRLLAVLADLAARPAPLGGVGPGPVVTRLAEASAEPAPKRARMGEGDDAPGGGQRGAGNAENGSGARGFSVPHKTLTVNVARVAREDKDDTAPDFNGPESAETVEAPPPAPLDLQYRPRRANEPHLSPRPTEVEGDKSDSAVFVRHDSDDFSTNFPGCWEFTSPDYTPSAETEYHDASDWAEPAPRPWLPFDDMNFFIQFVRRLYMRRGIRWGQD